MEKVLQDLRDAKQQIINFTDGRHYRVVEAITTAEQYIKDQNDKLDQYRKALIANVLQHYCPDWDGKERLYCYAEGAGERAFAALGINDGDDPDHWRKELYPCLREENSQET